MDSGDRARLFDELSRLSQADFERLLIAVAMPRMNRAGSSAKVGEQVSALLEWADSGVGSGLSAIQDYLDKWQSGSLPPAFDFSGYLEFIRQDPRYQDVRDLFTETEVLIPLEAETVERPASPEGGMRTTEVNQPKVERFPILEGLQKYALGEKRQHLLLAGRPGSGKSTTLKRVLLETADTALKQPEIIPVYVQLKGNSSVIDLIIAEFRRAKVRVTAEQIDEWLFNDLLLLLLDGVNEIPSKERRDQLNTFREDNPTTPMIFTTRDLAVGGDLGIQKRLEMRPLSEPQMREFVGKYLTQRGLPNQADTLLRQLKDRLREVAETPLLLKMLCDVFDSTTGQIPQSKGELFRLFDAKYDQFKGLVAVSEDFRRFKPELLQHLAFCMLQGDPANPTEAWLTIDRNRAERLIETYLAGRVEAPGQRAKEWLEDLLEHHLLQVATDPREIEFRHQLIQEYYAAEYLLRLLQPSDGEPGLTDDQLKQDYLNYLKWTEPVALMLALLEDEAQAVRVVKLSLDVDWQLGARLAGEVKPAFQQQTVLFVETFQVPSWLKVKLLVVARSEFSIPALLKALEDSNADVRQSAAEALGKLGSEAEIPALLKALEDSDADVHQSAAAALGQQLDAELVIPNLLEVLQHSSFTEGFKATKVLQKLDAKVVIPSLLKALEDSNFAVRWWAAYALGNLGVEAALPSLLKALEGSNSVVRGMAAEALEKLGMAAAVPGLLKALGDSNLAVRRRVAHALEKLGTAAAVPEMLKALENSDSDLRQRAAEVLGHLGAEAAIPALLKALEDPDNYVRQRAARALGQLGAEAAIPALFKALEDLDPGVRGCAAEALGKLGVEAAIPALFKALEDSDFFVRQGAIYALGQLGMEAAIPALVKALEDSDFVRNRAAEALGKLGVEAAIPALVKALEDSHNHVRRSAARALGTYQGNGAAQALPCLLNLVSIQASEEAFQAIVTIQKRCKFYNYEIWQEAMTIQNAKLEVQNKGGISKVETHQHFYGPVYGVAGNVEGNQTIPSPNSSQPPINPTE